MIAISSMGLICIAVNARGIYCCCFSRVLKFHRNSADMKLLSESNHADRRSCCLIIKHFQAFSMY